MNYNFSLRKKIQLRDEERDYTTNDCNTQNWLLFGGHTVEAFKLINGEFSDLFGRIKERWFSKIGIMSCAPDLVNSLLPKSKRFEELTLPYIPPLKHLPQDMRENKQKGLSFYLLPPQEIENMMIENGLQYDNQNYYEIPGEEIHNELKKRLKIMINEAKKKNKHVTIHVRCSPDILGLELENFVPSYLDHADGVAYLEAKTSFDSICGRTIYID